MSKSRSLQLFCAYGDLVSVFGDVEASVDLSYTRTGLFAEAKRPTFRSGKELPDLGISQAGETSREPSYLVWRAGVSPIVRPVAQKAGGTLYAVDQSLNPSSIVLKPGGVYADQCVIAGQLGTICEDEESVELYGKFATAIQDRCQRIGAYWLGPEAVSLLRAGRRLTIGINASTALDLRAPTEGKD